MNTPSPAKLCGMNINFDSLGEAYGFPKDYKDPAFFVASERFFEFSKKYSFKYSLFIIGKDLEKAENRELVKEWHNQGHEIGNHSYTHHTNLGSMKPSEIKDEVKKAHDLISETIGTEPKGFIAPNWSTSSILRSTLVELGYQYDTSTFPSWLMFPALAKIAWNHKTSSKLFRLFKRNDYFELAFGNPKPHFWNDPSGRGRLLIIPLPTTPLRVASWHTLAFTFGLKTHLSILRKSLNSKNWHYYLMHPADLLDSNDVDSNRSIHLERIGAPLSQKLKTVEESLSTITQNGFRLGTMTQLATWLISLSESGLIEGPSLK